MEKEKQEGKNKNRPCMGKSETKKQKQGCMEKERVQPRLAVGGTSQAARALCVAQ